MLARLAVVAVVAIVLLTLASCGDSPAQPGAREGDSAKGLALFMSNGCITCHSTSSMTGPRLDGIGDAYVAECGGDVAKAKSRVVAYLKDPRGVKPLVPRENPAFSQMPAYALVDEKQLAQIAEYILSIRDGRAP